MRVQSVNGLRLNSCLIDAYFVYCGAINPLARCGVDIEMSSFEGLRAILKGHQSSPHPALAIRPHPWHD